MTILEALDRRTVNEDEYKERFDILINLLKKWGADNMPEGVSFDWYSEFIGSGKKYDVCIVVNRNVYNDKKDDKYPLVASACFHDVFNDRFKNKAFIGQNFKGVNIDEILLTREFLSEYGL